MKIYLSILLVCFVLNNAKSIESKIIHNIENEVITNIDIKNEFKYLIALNNSLKELDKEKLLIISNQSIIREKIKKIEILKNFKEIVLNEDYYELLLKNIYTRLNLKSINEFDIYLKDYDLKIEDVKTKITIDALWNELIIKKYNSKIVINETKIKKEILKNSKISSKEYQLAEIIFEVTNKEEIEKKYNQIVKSINDIGFENSAAIYSFSESGKIGGDIGWINENSLNDNIKRNINNLQIGEITKPIILSNGILMLKLTSIKSSEANID
ncbi:peptidylprolyl isomerase, partial [Candidatus Pelagibacter sp.]|nr:peptidylprolyl isomerase [Candidatus Pelagibacter sp.]